MGYNVYLAAAPANHRQSCFALAATLHLSGYMTAAKNPFPYPVKMQRLQLCKLPLFPGSSVVGILSSKAPEPYSIPPVLLRFLALTISLPDPYRPLCRVGVPYSRLMVLLTAGSLVAADCSL